MNSRRTLAEMAAQCGNEMALPPAGSDQDAVFEQPWQAHAFAMTLALHERGLFTWKQWAARLSQRIKAAEASAVGDDGSHYYTHWLDALEQLVIETGVGSAAQIHELEHAWEDAARRTPHGQAIAPDPQLLDALTTAWPTRDPCSAGHGPADSAQAA